MPMYLDRHDVKGATPEAVAEAHVKDLEIQDRYNVKYISYWFDVIEGVAFCFCEAPNPEAALAVHEQAHGLMPGKIIPVDPMTITNFMGKIHEPAPGEPWAQSGFRTIIFTDVEESTALSNRIGDAQQVAHMRVHNEIVRDALARYEGIEVKHTGDGIMSSFLSVSKAVECAIAIRRGLAEHGRDHQDFPLRVRIGLSAGEPVTENDDLFGAAVALAKRVCDAAAVDQILVPGAVRELCVGKGFVFQDQGHAELKGFEEPVRLFAVAWQD